MNEFERIKNKPFDVITDDEIDWLITYINALRTANDLLHNENKEFESTLRKIYKFTLPCETNYENHINSLVKEVLF